MSQHQNLRNQIVTGSYWVFGANVLSRGITLLSTFVLMKILDPDNFGVIGYGFLIVSGIGLIREMGFSSALIYQKERVESAANTAFWFITIWSLFLYVLAFLLAPVAASFFREPRLTALLRVVMFSVVLNSCASISMSLMEKEINFKRRVIPELANLSVYGIVTSICAILGLRYWSFVVGVLVGDLVQFLLAFILRPIRLKFGFDKDLFHQLFGFGKNVMGLGILNFGIRNVDDFFVGRMLGTTPLGIYQLAYRLANIPATNITNVMGKVLFPGFTRLADDPIKLKSGFEKSFQYVTFVTIPITFYIVLVTPEVILRFFPQWQSAIVPIQLIAYFGGIRSISAGLGKLFLAKGVPHRLIPVSLFQFGFLSIFLYPTIHYFGLVGVCILVNIAITVAFIWSFILAANLVPITLRGILRILAKPVVISTFLFLMIYVLCVQCGDNRFAFIIMIKMVSFPVLYLIFTYCFSNVPRQLYSDFFHR